jgi:hypothetical protein
MGWLVLRCSEKSSSTSEMPRLRQVELGAPGPQYCPLHEKHAATTSRKTLHVRRHMTALRHHSSHSLKESTCHFTATNLFTILYHLFSSQLLANLPINDVFCSSTTNLDSQWMEYSSCHHPSQSLCSLNSSYPRQWDRHAS